MSWRFSSIIVYGIYGFSYKVSKNVDTLVDYQLDVEDEPVEGFGVTCVFKLRYSSKHQVFIPDDA